MSTRARVWCGLAASAVLGGWLALRPPGSVSASRNRGTAAPQMPAAQPQPRVETRTRVGPESHEALLQRLAAMTTPEAEAQAEQERLERDRSTYRELTSRYPLSELERSLLRSLTEQSRYPANNQRFPTERYDPVLRAREVERRSARSRDGGLELTIFTDQKQYDLGATVQLHATLRSTTSRASSPPLQATLRSESAAITSLELSENAPGSYAATIDTTQVAGKQLSPGIYLLRVHAPDGTAQSTAFVMRAAYGRLTGRYRDAPHPDGLAVEAEVEVLTDGDFHLFASLYAADGLPVGSTEQNQILSRGTHWVQLPFHGKLLHDAGSAGPYRLAHVRLEKLSFPVSEGVDADPNYFTARYSLDDFDDAPYNPLDLPEPE